MEFIIPECLRSGACLHWLPMGTCDSKPLTLPCRYGKILTGICQGGFVVCHEIWRTRLSLQKEWRERTMKLSNKGYSKEFWYYGRLWNLLAEKQNIKQSEYLRLAVAERLEEEGYETGYKTSSTNNA